MKQHDGFIKNSDVNVLLAGGGHKPLSEFLDASSLKTVNGQSLVGIGDISAGGETIVPSSGSTLTAEVGKYYRYDTIVNSLTVTLPSTALFTSTQKITIYFQANVSNALTLSSSNNIKYMNGYDIQSGSTYEVTIMWNGHSWIVTLIEIEGLPAGAKRIEYVASDGYSWIDPQVSAAGGTIIDATFSVPAFGDYFPCMSHNSTGANSYDRNFFRVYSGYINCMKCGSGQNVTGSFSVNTVIRFTLNTIGTKFSGALDGITKFDLTTSEVLASSAGNLGIFKNMHNGAISNGVKIYGLKLYNSNNALVRDFIPVKINNTGYLYDKISKQLYGNAGSGSLVLGPEL